jgi:hypothetical protein
MDVTEIGWGATKWINLAQDDQWRSLVKPVTNLKVLQYAGKFFSS